MKTNKQSSWHRSSRLGLLLVMMLAAYSGKATTYTVSNTSNSGSGSLRTAINNANSNSGADVIEFSTSGTITLSSILPLITDPVSINGYTATGAAQGTISGRTIKITVDGGNTTSTTSSGGRSDIDGLFRFTSGASGSSISGLSIINTGNSVEAILVEPGTSNIHIWGNYIGITAAGTATSGSRLGDDCIMIGVPNSLSSTPSPISNITIGTDGNGNNDANEGNALGNTNRSGGGDGIQVGALPSDQLLTVKYLKISGNYIGLCPDGSTIAKIGDNAGNGAKGGAGVFFNSVLGTKNLIGSNGDGTSDVLERNIISGCALSGIIFNGATNTDISGNYIGTDATGLIAKPNSDNTNDDLWDGITIMSEYRATPATSSVNIPSSNINVGFIDSLHAISVAANVRNIVSGNNGMGIEIILTGAPMYPQQNSITVAGNYIGVDVTGNSQLGNGQNSTINDGTGIYVEDAKEIVIGTNGNGVKDAVEGNVISGNLLGPGIFMQTYSAGFPMKDSRISGNKIGVGANGTTAIGNDGPGIFIKGATNIIVGSDDNNTSDAIEANIIANNAFGFASTGGSSDGVRVTDTASKVRISRNVFYSNKANPIDLANNGVSVNDGTTTLAQPNRLLDYPVFTSAKISGSTMTVSGYIGTCNGNKEYVKGTTISGTQIVQVYKVADDGDQNGALTGNGCSRSTSHGEGVQYLGSITATNGEFNAASFTLVAGASFSAGDKVTGITIDASGNTSEFGVMSLLAISGSVFDDGNGNTTIQSPSERFTSLPAPLYIYLVDATGKVQDSANVAPNGSYVLDAEGNKNYSLILSKVSYPIGTDTTVTPINRTLPTDWVTTGENKANNTGSGDGTPNGLLSISVNTDPTAELNFGIEKLPTSQNVTVTIPTPSGSSISQGTVTNISANAVVGSDLEDGTMGNSKTIVITQLPTNGVMSYNGTLVTLNQQITNFDPSKLSFSSLNTGTTSTNFKYAFIDAAGKQGSTSTYTINWPGALPIELISFDARKAGTTSLLNWTTAKEEGIAGFTIERSGNGNQWNQIGFEKPANDRSISVQDYKFEDALPMQGQNFYRLKIVERDGKQSYSMVRSLWFGSNSVIKVYPNPVQDKLMLTGLTGTNQIMLLDFSGRVVYQAEISTTNTVIPVSTLPSGNYQLKIVDDNGTIFTQTLIK